LRVAITTTIVLSPLSEATTPVNDLAIMQPP
jgi:hypothetical protein